MTVKLKAFNPEEVEILSVMSFRCDYSCAALENMKRMCPGPQKPPEEKNKATVLQILEYFPKKCHLFKKPEQLLQFHLEKCIQ